MNIAVFNQVKCIKEMLKIIFLFGSFVAMYVSAH